LQIDHRAQYKLKIAREFEEQNKPLYSIQIYLLLINDYPNFTEPYFRLAEIYENLGKLNSAIDLFENISNLQPEDKDVKLYYGQFLIRNAKWEKAIEVLSAISVEEEPIVFYFTGYAYFMSKDFELAKINFLSFIISDEQPEIIQEAYLYLAKIEIELKEFDSALRYAKRAEVLFSDFWELHVIYAQIYSNQDMINHAIKSVEKAVRFNSKEPTIFAWAGKIYYKNNDYKMAEEYFTKFIELSENISSEDYTLLAEVYLHNGKFNEAVNFFDSAVKLDPKNKTAVAGKNNAQNLLTKNSISDV
jgi:tetratricopeptide (TPR) repeat protein